MTPRSEEVHFSRLELGNRFIEASKSGKAHSFGVRKKQKDPPTPGYKVVSELRSGSNSSRELIPRSLLQPSQDVYGAAVQETCASEETN